MANFVSIQKIKALYFKRLTPAMNFCVIHQVYAILQARKNCLSQDTTLLKLAHLLLSDLNLYL